MSSHFTHLCVHYIVGDTKRAYRVLVGKRDVKLPEGRSRFIWEDNIKTDLHKVGCGGMDWIDLAQDRDRGLALMNAEIHLQVSQNTSKFSVTCGSVSFSVESCSMEFVK